MNTAARNWVRLFDVAHAKYREAIREYAEVPSKSTQIQLETAKERLVLLQRYAPGNYG